MSQYEAMFVLSNKEGKSGHEAAEEHIRMLCGKVDAELVRMGKWDERQLSYEIAGQRDGVFFLAFLEGEGSIVAPLKREAELSDQVLRLLILRLDSIPSEDDVRKQSGRSKPEPESQEGEAAADAPKEEAAADAPKEEAAADAPKAEAAADAPEVEAAADTPEVEAAADAPVTEASAEAEAASAEASASDKTES